MSPDRRAAMMASIRHKDTKPELAVRRILWRLGARYRLHAKELPGRPDIVMRPKRVAILVQGCLWHLHEGCKLARIPKSRPDYWPSKLARNKERDQRNLKELGRLGWRAEVIWECETSDSARLERRLSQLLSAIRCATP
jgi:DNA mismatch endonuclease (patch repair protein)